MDLPVKQVQKLINSSRRVLLTGPENPQLDAVSTATAWWLFLTKLGKKVDIALAGRVASYKFLGTMAKPSSNLGNISKFKIVLDTSDTKVKQLSYDMADDKLEINIVPEGGSFSAKDVVSEQGDYKYDLVISLGASSLEGLGEIFQEHRHFFHEVAIVNIDRSLLNENFGQVNIIEARATSLAEISQEFMKEKIDADMATCLLAGMIAATNSFQSAQVTPQSLELASQLIILGARREDVVEELYRTKNIATLKNWGKVLSRLDKQGNVLSSYLEHDEADNLPEDFREMVRDLILSAPGAQVAIILYQLELSKTEAWIYTINNIKAIDLVKDRGASGHRSFARLTIDKSLEQSRDDIGAHIAQKLKSINQD